MEITVFEIAMLVFLLAVLGLLFSINVSISLNGTDASRDLSTIINLVDKLLEVSAKTNDELLEIKIDLDYLRSLEEKRQDW